MTVNDCADYDSEFPEKFNWGTLDSPGLSIISDKIARQIIRILSADPEFRHEVPGLRRALQLLAETAEV